MIIFSPHCISSIMNEQGACFVFKSVIAKEGNLHHVFGFVAKLMNRVSVSEARIGSISLDISSIIKHYPYSY